MNLLLGFCVLEVTRWLLLKSVLLHVFSPPHSLSFLSSILFLSPASLLLLIIIQIHSLTNLKHFAFILIRDAMLMAQGFDNFMSHAFFWSSALRINFSYPCTARCRSSAARCSWSECATRIEPGP